MIIQGKSLWAKVGAEPAWGYERAFREWSLDVVVNEETEERLKAEGLGKRLKENKNGETYIKFSRKEFKSDGTPNKPIRIVGPDGKTEWPLDKKIGNGSTVNINFAINEHKKYGNLTNILSMQVYKPVAYDGGEFEANPELVKSGEEDWSE